MEVLLYLFPVAQGAAIFTTAWLLMRLWGKSHPLLKVAAMTISYVGWCLFTILLYGLLGGGGLMEGGFLLVAALGSALLSAGLYLAGWMMVPLFKSRQHG